MIWINSEVLKKFSEKGYTINEGIDSIPQRTMPRRAVDASLIQSARHPLSEKEIKKHKEKRQKSEGKLERKENLATP